MLSWKDGQPFSNRFDDVYFSTDSGLEEARHVFLHGNDLPERFSALRPGEVLTIGETGFGTGLNFLCASRLFQEVSLEGSSLDFFSIEKYPLSDNDLKLSLDLWPELEPLARELRDHWRRRVHGWNRWTFAGGRIRLTLAIIDVADALWKLPGGFAGEGRVDAWFLDGFSPAKNPDMWASAVFSGMVKASRSGATLATYSSAGWVRRGLEDAGFKVAKAPGFGRKREMTRGRLAGEFGDAINAPRSAVIIGGGLAGCAAAYALARRGVAVTLIEQAGHLASGASGNPRGILHARFSAGMNPLHRFVLASYGYSLAQLDELLPVDGVVRAECGLLQQAFSDVEIKRIGRLVSLDWPVPVFEAVDAEKASKCVGIPMEQGGLWFPSAGWVSPPELCRRWASSPGIEVLLEHEVVKLEATSAGWRVEGMRAGGAWQMDADCVVVCSGHQARKLPQFARFPLTPVRGQISMIPATSGSLALTAVICAEGYCAPARDGFHVAGATHTFGDESTDTRSTDHAVNLARMNQHMPALRKALGEFDLEQLGGRASIRCSAPGAMPLVGRVQSGLYCSLAHGTRGLITAGISGELIASQLCGTLPPLPMTVVAELSPEARVTSSGDE